MVVMLLHRYHDAHAANDFYILTAQSVACRWRVVGGASVAFGEAHNSALEAASERRRRAEGEPVQYRGLLAHWHQAEPQASKYRRR